MKEDEIKNIFQFYKIIQIKKKTIERIWTKSKEKKIERLFWNFERLDTEIKEKKKKITGENSATCTAQTWQGVYLMTY